MCGKPCLMTRSKLYGPKSELSTRCLLRNLANKDNKPTDTKVKFGPNTTRKVTNASVIEESDDDKEDTDDEEPPPGTIRAKINSIMSGARSQNVVRCVTASSSYDNLLLIDGGADTCMMGHDFFIESRSSRTVTVEGFGGSDTTIRNMTLGNGITKVTMVGKDPFLMRVSDGIISSHKSILSSNQLWHYGCKVEDTPRKYGGRQVHLVTRWHLCTPTVQHCSLLHELYLTYC